MSFISREAAIDALESTDWYHQGPNKNMVHGANSLEHQAWYREQDVYAAIKAIPAADVVERDCFDRLLAENDELRNARPVVRCADCKWFQINMRQDGYLPKGVPECECRHWCGSCDPTDFCSYGER